MVLFIVAEMVPLDIELILCNRVKEFCTFNNDGMDFAGNGWTSNGRWVVGVAHNFINGIAFSWLLVF